MALSQEQWNNIKIGDSLLTENGEVFEVVSKINDRRGDKCIIKRRGSEKLKEVEINSHFKFTDICSTHKN